MIPTYYLWSILSKWDASVQDPQNWIGRTRTSYHIWLAMGRKLGWVGSSSQRARKYWADCMCVALQVWSVQCGCNISVLEVAQSYSVSLRALFGKDPSRPNFCSIADGAMIHGGIGSPGSPYLILWTHLKMNHFRHYVILNLTVIFFR